jgi:4-amino-4-deoxy-L-arabinose transferase-like glycosyltransferase
MMIASSAGGDLLDYRNEILFTQTVTRYADAWHHHEPVWYYVTNVIPALWLPLIALVPWLWPRWRTALRERDTLVAVLLAWVVIVLLFFSLSSGKRGVYVLPAVPALAMAAAPWLPELLRARGPRRLAFVLAILLAGFGAAAAIYFAVDPSAAARLVDLYSVHPVLPLSIVAVAGAAAIWLLRERDGWLAYAATLGIVLVTTGLVIAPQIDPVRSGRAFVERLEKASTGIADLGLVGFKDQYLLQLRRPTTNFGHARWREEAAEAADAAAWLAARPGRALLMHRVHQALCFKDAAAADLGRANGKRWSLVTGPADPGCIQRGDRSRARLYLPPNASLNTDG